MAYTKELYANNARTTLAGGLTNVATSIVLQTGAGALFPNPNNAIGEFAKATLQDAATVLRNEIVYITAKTGDVLTVVRGQDGTTAQTWSAGDTVFEGVTAATLSNFLQPVDVQGGHLIYAVASGTTTAYTATFSPAIAILTDGMLLEISTSSVGTNTTTTPTFSPNGLTARNIVKQDGAALEIGDLPNRAVLSYDVTNTRWILLNPVKGQAAIVTQSIAEGGADTSIWAWTAQRVRQAIVKGLVYSFATNGYIKFPEWLGGFMIVWGVVSTLQNGSVQTFTTPFLNNVFLILATHYQAPIIGGNVTSAIAVNKRSLTQFDTGASVAGSSSVYYIAIGN